LPWGNELPTRAQVKKASECSNDAYVDVILGSLKVNIPFNISVKKFKDIKQAVSLWKSSKSNIRMFANKLKHNGWKEIGLGYKKGAFKRCFSKGSIVVKYSRNKRDNFEIKREWEQWNVAPSGLKKHLAYLYCMLDNRVLIQDKVLLVTGGGVFRANQIV